MGGENTVHLPVLHSSSVISLLRCGRYLIIADKDDILVSDLYTKEHTILSWCDLDGHGPDEVSCVNSMVLCSDTLVVSSWNAKIKFFETTGHPSQWKERASIDLVCCNPWQHGRDIWLLALIIQK